MKVGGEAKPKQQGTLAFLSDEGLRLLLFGGKGGVGKTTCAVASALTLAQQHPERPFLLISTDPAHSLFDCFAGTTPPDNLTLCELDPQESLLRFKANHEVHLRTIALRGTFLDESDVTRFLNLSMPGLDEIMALLEMAAWVKQDRYACIVVDTAPAGHTLRLLELPEVMRQWVNTLDTMLTKHRYLAKLYRGVYRKDAVDQYLEQTLDDLAYLGVLLRSPERCRFVPVMLAEALSIHVTRRMLNELRQLHLPVRELIVNRLRSMQAHCPVCIQLFARQSVATQELKQVFSDYNLWGLPLFLEEMRGTERLLTVWQHAQPLAQAQWANNEVALTNAGVLTNKSPSGSDIQCVAVSHPAPLPAASIKLILFAGKGGVGKTTLACASALHLAEKQNGKEILLFSIDPAHSLAACFGRVIGPKEVRVAPGLSVVELDAQAEYVHLKKDYAKELHGFFEHATREKGIDLAFDRQVVEQILDLAPPGLDEILALSKIVEMMERKQYDLFILDTAPTGHLLRFLEMPELIEQWLKAFFALFLKYRETFWLPRVSQMMVDLSRRIKVFRQVLLDARQTMLVAVAIPTEMAYAETNDLVTACERLGVAVPILWLNMLTPSSSCPICSVLCRAEKLVIDRYNKTFAVQHRTLVYRQKEEPCGIEPLYALGRSLYLA